MIHMTLDKSIIFLSLQNPLLLNEYNDTHLSGLIRIKWSNVHHVWNIVKPQFIGFSLQHPVVHPQEHCYLPCKSMGKNSGQRVRRELEGRGRIGNNFRDESAAWGEKPNTCTGYLWPH